jgi:DNA uptake protein ComE-like DNA-binding protein
MAVGTVLLAFAVGCSSKRMSNAYHDVVGDKEQAKTDKVDINTATRGQLAKLPGLTDADADRIIANRPYGDKKGLLRKSVLSEKQYDKVQDYVYASTKR